MRSIIVKYLFGSETHRFVLEEPVTLNQIQEKIKEQLGLLGNVYLSYFDKDNDDISLTNDQDLLECFRFYQSQGASNEKEEQMMTVRFHVTVSPPGGMWLESFIHEWREKLPSKDQIRDFTIGGFHALEKALNDLAFKAEESVFVAAESSKKIFNHFCHRLVPCENCSSINPTHSANDMSFRLSAKLVSTDPFEEVSISPISSKILNLTFENNGTMPWPMDTKLDLNTAANAVFLKDAESVLLIRKNLEVGSDVSKLEPGAQLSVSVIVVAAAGINMGRFQGFWKISSSSSFFPQLIPIQWHIVEAPRVKKSDDDFIELK